MFLRDLASMYRENMGGSGKVIQRENHVPLVPRCQADVEVTAPRGDTEHATGVDRSVRRGGDVATCL